MPERITTKEIRKFLRKTFPRILDREVSDILERELPRDWRNLIDEFGRERVFDCLRLDYTLGGAMRRLR